MKSLALIAALCTVQGVSSFVFSCEEIKSKMVNSARIESTTSACVFLEDGLLATTPYLNSVFVQGQKDKTSYTLASIASSPSGCVSGSGPWQVIADDPSLLQCDKEITLIFSSDSETTYFVATQYDNMVTPGPGRLTIVSPAAGMRISTNNMDGDLSIYTGAGKGGSEFMYILKSWSLWDVPRHISSFDNVLTLETTAKNPTYYITAEYHNKTQLGVGDKAVILTSGKSDNLMDKHPAENYVSYGLWSAATATVHGNFFLDPDYQGYVNISVSGEFMNEERTFRDEVIDWEFYASTFQVKYLTAVKPDDIWDNQDTFVIEIVTSELPTDLTPIPEDVSTQAQEEEVSTPAQAVSTPEKPVTYAVSTMAPAPPASDDYCNCRIVDDWYGNWDATDIWVDLVVIIDTSSSMGKSMDEATALISSFVGELTTDLNAPFYSRIGVIAVSQTADVIYNLNMTNSDNLNLKQSGVPKIDVGAAFQAALKMFADGESLPGYREKAKQIVYYLTNSAPGSNMNGVDDFKTNGGTIIVNDFVLEGDTPNPDLKKLASNNFFFTDLSENYVNSLALFCEVNCFCDADAHAFNDDLISPRTQANRGCFHPVNSGIPQARARDTCQKEGGDLPSIHDAQKEYFVNSVISVFGNKKKYWLGIENVNDNWSWYDQSTDPFTDWDANQPNTNGGKLNCAYAVQTTGLNVKWTAANCAMGGILYVCESAPCSRGNDKCE